MKARLIVATLLALVTGTAAASDWQIVCKSANGDICSVDVASLTRHGNIVRAWFRAVYAEPQEVGGVKYLSERTRYYFDCAERRVALKQSTAFADKEFNEVVYFGPSHDDALLKWRDVAPDSMIESQLEVACAEAPK
jgi:hypothetical protein